MAHIKIALIKCKNIPPTVFPPSVLLVILLKSAILYSLFSLCPLKAAGGDSLLLPMGSPLLPDTGLAVWPTQRLPAPCAVSGGQAPWLVQLREDSRLPGQVTAQPGGRSLVQSELKHLQFPALCQACVYIGSGYKFSSWSS